MVKMAVGCPVAGREWILPTWHDHLIASASTAGVEVELFFVVPSGEQELINLLRTFPETKNIHGVQESDEREDHNWSGDRLRHMVDLRNINLRAVRYAAPDYYFSLDSDILVPPDLVGNLLETMETTDADAVGGKAYMTPLDTCFASYGVWREGRKGWDRRDTEGVRRCDILMAVKMMSKPVYQNVDYEFAPEGEDLGWSMAAQAKGYNLYFDGRIACKHVMAEHQLGVLDKRCGF